MIPIILSPGTADNQAKTLTISPNDHTISLRVNIRYLYRTDKWYMSITDGLTGESIVQYVPLVAGDLETLNNLLIQFGYKGIGSAFVIPKGNNENSDPVHETINDYWIVWGDAYA